ncbi:hypothetical protein GW17_00061186, partial [Ensete ventricosum]
EARGKAREARGKASARLAAKELLLLLRVRYLLNSESYIGGRVRVRCFLIFFLPVLLLVKEISPSSLELANDDEVTQRRYTLSGDKPLAAKQLTHYML